MEYLTEVNGCTQFGMENFACTDCDLLFVDYKKFVVHRMYHGHSTLKSLKYQQKKRQTVCPLCTKRCSTLACYNDFLLLGRALIADIDWKYYKCNCFKNYSELSEMILDGKEIGEKHVTDADQSYFYSLSNYSQFSQDAHFTGHYVGVNDNNDVDNKDVVPCNICFKRFPQKKIHNHKKTHKANLFKCPYCDKMFLHNCHLKEHIEIKHGEAIYDCETCGRSFTCLKYLKQHRKIHNENCHQCPHCEKKFHHRYRMTQHIEMKHNAHAKQYPCDICFKPFSCQRYLDVHRRIHVDEMCFKCPHCDKKFARKNTWRTHIERVHNTKYVKCDVCPKVFTHERGLKAHRKVHSGERFQCPHCEKSFHQKFHLKQHLGLRHGADVFTCDICMKTFTCLAYLKHHLVVHNEDERFKCPLCPSNFTRKSACRVHIERVHSDSRVTCDFCLKMFTHQYDLTAHQKMHVEESYKCLYCQEKLNEGSLLRNHIETVHEDMIKLFRCDQCTKSYSCKKYLKDHKRIHNEEKCYKCPQCSKKFARRNSCRRHVGTMHKKDETEISSVSGNNPQGDIEKNIE